MVAVAKSQTSTVSALALQGSADNWWPADENKVEDGAGAQTITRKDGQSESHISF